MVEKIENHQRTLLASLIAVCIVLITIGGAAYISGMRKNLQNTTIQSVMSATIQQPMQSIFPSVSSDFGRARELLGFFDDVDAFCLVMSLDGGWSCGTTFDDIRQLEQEDLDICRSLQDSGVRDSCRGLNSKTQIKTQPASHRSWRETGCLMFLSP